MTLVHRLFPARRLGVGLSAVAAVLGLFAGPAPGQTSYSWANGVTGTWQTQGNWNPNGIPGTNANDTVSITQAGTYSVTMTLGVALASVTINASGATLDTSAQTFTVNTALNLTAGTLITSGGTTAAATWTTSAGTNWNWTAGTLSGAGTYSNGGTLTMSVATSAPNLSSALVNTGTFLWNGSAAIFPQTGASINNSGLFNIRADGTVVQNTFFTATFTNTGTIRKSLGSGTSTIQATLTSTTGTIDVQTGTLSFAGGGTVSGSISAASGATVNLGGLTLTGTLTGSGAGTVNINGTAVTASGVTLNYTGAQAVWNNGAVNGTGTITVPAGAQLNLGGSGNKLLNGTLSIAGTFVTTATGPLTMNTGSGVVVASTGVFDVQADNNVFLPNGSVGAVTNSGVMRKTVGSGTTTLNFPVVNAAGGTLSVQSGTLAVSQGLTFDNSNVEIKGGNTSNLVLNVPGAVTQTGSAVLTIKVLNDGTLNTSGSTQYTWTVLTGNGTNLTSLGLSAFAVAGGNVPITNGSVSFSGSNVVIQFTPVPEPTGLVLAAGLIFAGGAAVRRRFARI
jgi:hypothetical protein